MSKVSLNGINSIRLFNDCKQESVKFNKKH